MDPTQIPETSFPPEFFDLLAPRQTDSDVERLLARGKMASQLEALPDAAARAGLLPLLSWRLMDQAAVPGLIRRQLEDAFHRNNLRNLMRVGELVSLCRELDAKGVRSLMIKGPVLASLCYGNLGLRQFDDLDILVHPEDIQVATRVILDRGYRFWLPEWQQEELDSFFARPDYRRFLWWDQIMFTRSDPKTTLELHWAALPGYFAFDMPFQELWESHETHSLSGYTLRTLSAPHTVLLIIGHGSKHVWSSAKWVCDLSWAVSRFPGLDWFELEKEAEKRGGVRMLHVASLLSRRLFAAPLPDAWAKHIQSSATTLSIASRIQSDLLESIWRGSVYQEKIVARLRLRERNRDRMKYLLRSLLTPSARDCRWLPLPPALFSLYRVLRPVRLCCEWACNALPRGRAQSRTSDPGSAETGDVSHHGRPDLAK